MIKSKQEKGGAWAAQPWVKWSCLFALYCASQNPLLCSSSTVDWEGKEWIYFEVSCGVALTSRLGSDTFLEEFQQVKGILGSLTQQMCCSQSLMSFTNCCWLQKREPRPLSLPRSVPLLWSPKSGYQNFEIFPGFWIDFIHFKWTWKAKELKNKSKYILSGYLCLYC